MKKYEIMFIVRPDLEEASIKKTAQDLENILKNNGAEKVELQDLGQKQLAYEIKKYSTGYYFLINVECSDLKCINELNRLTLINEDVIRHLIIKKED